MCANCWHRMAGTICANCDLGIEGPCVSLGEEGGRKYRAQRDDELPPVVVETVPRSVLLHLLA